MSLSVQPRHQRKRTVERLVIYTYFRNLRVRFGTLSDFSDGPPRMPGGKWPAAACGGYGGALTAAVRNKGKCRDRTSLNYEGKRWSISRLRQGCGDAHGYRTPALHKVVFVKS